LEDVRPSSVLYVCKYFVDELPGTLKIYSAMLWYGLVAILTWYLIVKGTFKAFSMIIVKVNVVDP
jgi:hypothetical protein